MIERYVCNFKTRCDIIEWRLRVIREQERCEGYKKKRAEVRRLTSFEKFRCETENFVLDSLTYLEPVRYFKIGVV